MIRIELATLIKRLHPISRQIFESTAATCVSRQGTEITVSDFLLQCLETPLCDVRTILAAVNIDKDALKALLIQPNHDSSNYAQSYPSFSPLLIELLQDAWLLTSAELQQEQIRSGTVLLALLHSPHRYLPAEAVKQLLPINKELVLAHFSQWTKGSAEEVNLNKNNTLRSNTHQASENSLLAQYATNITELAKNNKLDPVLCRDNEIDLMIDILCRRRKNNPIIVGEAGVGKSALIEGLALRIVNNSVPEKLHNTAIMSLDLGALQAGASVKGEFEKRFKGIMNEILHSPTPIIMFIDEAHTLIGAGNQQGGLDISNLLKPALARGELKTVAATTWSEYKKYFEKDAALSRRFQLVQVSEPTADEAVIILRGLRQIYETSHNVLIDDDALQSAAKLSDRYLSGRQLPDKAIDVLDTSCARIAINLTSPPRQIIALRNQLHQYKAEIALLERESKLGLKDNKTRLKKLATKCKEAQKELDEIHALWEKQQSLVNKIIQLRKVLLAEPVLENTELLVKNNKIEQKEQQKLIKETTKELEALTAELDKLQKNTQLISPHVNKAQIAAVIAEWTGVPLNRISQNELVVVTQLPDYLGQEIKGQDLAIEVLHKHLLTARADLRRQGRPLGAFLLVGPSGVGKTESVLQISELLFGGRQYLTTINMSEFQEKHTVSRLIGSPPGYVGYGEGGVLTEAIRKKPYSVVLLDEVEKAHPDVLNLFYQAFDKGELADGEGRIIDCKNIVFFLTSNLGYQTIVNYANEPNLIMDKLYPELADFFKPALLARMEVVPYLPLPLDVLSVITQGKLNKLIKTLTQRFDADVIIEDSVAKEIIARATRSENGARMLESIIDGHLLPPVSLQILNTLAAGKKISHIHFSVNDHQFISTITEKKETTQKEKREKSAKKLNNPA